jgi:hypothetical protein
VNNCCWQLWIPRCLARPPGTSARSSSRTATRSKPNQYFSRRAAFLGSVELLTSPCPKTRLVLLLGLNGNTFGFVCPQPTRAHHHPIGGPAILLRPRSSSNPCTRCRNINLLSITYALRPPLRIRLTPGGLTWPGKPWVYGERVSHSFSRYSLWHNLSSTLQLSFRSTFTALTMLPYHTNGP